MFKKGDRIRLVKMVDDPCPIDPGTTGTIIDVHDISFLGTDRSKQVQLTVDWDNGRTLSPIIPPDEIELIKEEQHGEVCHKNTQGS